MDSHILKTLKRVLWTKKHCMLCKKHDGPHKTHITCDCCWFNKDGTPIKRNGGTGKSNSKEKKSKGANFVQVFLVELKKAFHKHTQKHKKCHTNKSESEDNSGYSS